MVSAKIVPYNLYLKNLLLQFDKNKEIDLRIDKFLNCVNITKRRAISEDMCKSGVVSINDTIVKPAKVVKIGDVITIKYLKHTSKYEVLEIPATKTIPKTMQSKYVKEI